MSESVKVLVTVINKEGKRYTGGTRIDADLLKTELRVNVDFRQNEADEAVVKLFHDNYRLAVEG